MKTQFRLAATCLGHVGIVAGPRGLRRLYLPHRSKTAQRQAIKSDFETTTEDDTLLPELADALRRYFDGERVEFDIRLDCDGAAEFTAAIWRACRRVPYGKTVSYKQLAARAGCPGAARAVGSALGRNPFPIVVPCHRVIKADGSLGGYSGPGGVEFKRRLLTMEAAAIRPAQRA